MTGNLKEKSFKVRTHTPTLLMRGEEIYLTSEFGRKNFSQSACLVPDPYFEKMYVPTALWTWVWSRQPVSGMGVKHLLSPLRPAWGSVWLGMKCSEARCDRTARAHPPVSQLTHTKTQHSRSAVEETLDCSSMMARSQMSKEVETALNKGYFYLHHNHHENTIKTINPCALTKMDILITVITEWKLAAT